MENKLFYDLFDTEDHHKVRVRVIIRNSVER